MAPGAAPAERQVQPTAIIVVGVDMDTDDSRVWPLEVFAKPLPWGYPRLDWGPHHAHFPHRPLLRSLGDG